MTAQPAGGIDRLGQGREVSHAKQRLAPVDQRQQSAKEGHAADKGFGAVDRINDPVQPGGVTLRAIFLTDNSMFRPTPGNELTNGLLGLAVRQRDGGIVRFALDHQVALEIAQLDGLQRTAA